jgi:Zn-dependent M28 family amino/carboxypeptidase
MKRESRTTAVVVVLCTLVFGCGRMADSARPVPEGKSAGEFGESLSQLVTTEALVGHLSELQAIADRHDGNRAVGTPGYDASVEYVAGVLRDSGFDVQLPEFQLRVFETEKPELTVAGAAIDARALEYSAGTPGVSGPLVAAPADDTPGCVPADYDGLPVKGAVVLVDRGSCPFAEKQAIAAKLGAVAVVVANNVDEEKMGGTLGSDTEVTIPVISVSKADGARLRAAPGPTTVKLAASTKTVSARNVIAETKTGSAQDVVMVGAHLDSVADGPGINDNGSGIAAVLETAVQLGSAPDVKNAVRFGFWGAEELGIIGSQKYLESLDVEGLKDIALYLNFDMIGSPNPGYFTYDGDQSTALERDESPPRVPEGSPGIERTLAEYLDSVGKTAEDTSFDGRSDYDGFTRAGIPAGGLFTGAEEKMTADEAELWDGTADAPFDPNYHTDNDTLANVDRDALGINGGGVAYVVGVYAQDLDGRNGMPAREDRTRHAVVAEP